MATRKRPALRRDEDEPDIELEVFEHPLDPLFPRLPNVVSRRGHRAVRVRIRVGDDVIPPGTTKVRLDAEVVSYGPDRIGTNKHLFRHRLTWGTNFVIIDLRRRRRPYVFDLIVPRDLGDDHIGEGPYDAIVQVTPDPVALDGSKTAKVRQARANTAAATSDGEPKVVLRFITM